MTIVVLPSLNSEIRSGLGYPPFGSMIRLIFRGESESRTNALSHQSWSRRCNAIFRPQEQQEVRVLGPTAAPSRETKWSFSFSCDLMQAADKEDASSCGPSSRKVDETTGRRPMARGR